MKITASLALFICTISIHAQVGTATSPRTLTRRIAPQLPPQQPAYRAPGQAANAAPATKAPLTAEQLEEQKMQQAAEDKKKLQWQSDRAKAGSDPAQYALGMRYLEGNGVKKDPKLARKWLEESAKQGNAEAKKALAEHPELPPLDEKKPDATPTALKAP